MSKAVGNIVDDVMMMTVWGQVDAGSVGRGGGCGQGEHLKHMIVKQLCCTPEADTKYC